MQWKAIFVGDIVIQHLPAEGHFLSAGMQKLLSEHAIRSCNFEAPLAGAGKPIHKAGPHLQQHKEAARLVEDAGFNVINLANNHIYDYGQEALTHTQNAFREALCVGAGATFEAAYALQQITVGQVSVGLLSFCEAEFGALTVSRSHSGGYAWINHPQVSSIVLDARSKVDVLLIQCHAGVELMDMPLPEWREKYRELIRLGADAVIASHPHVPQGFEHYQGKPIFYSLGNFYFDSDSTHPLWNKGIAVSLTFEGSKLTGTTIHSIARETSGVELIEDGSFEKHLEHLQDVLTEPGYTQLINRVSVTLWKQYYRSYYDMALQGISNHVSLGQFAKTVIKRLVAPKRVPLNRELLLHNIRIESHRWLVERALEEINKS